MNFLDLEYYFTFAMTFIVILFLRCWTDLFYLMILSYKINDVTAHQMNKDNVNPDDNSRRNE